MYNVQKNFTPQIQSLCGFITLSVFQVVTYFLYDIVVVKHMHKFSKRDWDGDMGNNSIRDKGVSTLGKSGIEIGRWKIRSYKYRLFKKCCLRICLRFKGTTIYHIAGTQRRH